MPQSNYWPTEGSNVGQRRLRFRSNIGGGEFLFLLGNFPQAYSHIGLINCALGLSRQKGPAEDRAESQGPSVSVA
jgi:hypothetical protein